MKKALSLAESMIVLIIIAFIAMLMLSTFDKLQPDKNKIIFKKAYSITERVVGELINDESIYPYDPNRLGFKNTDKACIPGLTKEECDACVPNDSTNNCSSGLFKFTRFFARKLNIIGDVERVFAAANKFETTDGMMWQIDRALSNGAHTGGWFIRVDVNGNDGPNYPRPNQDISSYGGPNVTTETVLSQEINAEIDGERDRFFIFVDFDGRVRVLPNSLEAEYLKSHETTRRR